MTHGGAASVPLRAPLLIARKRDGEELSPDDIAC
jgi:hypothetical protein